MLHAVTEHVWFGEVDRHPHLLKKQCVNIRADVMHRQRPDTANKWCQPVFLLTLSVLEFLSLL